MAGLLFLPAGTLAYWQAQKVEGAVTPPLARYVATLEAAQRTAVATLDATSR